MDSFTKKYVFPSAPTKQQILEDLQTIFDSKDQPSCESNEKDHYSFLQSGTALEGVLNEFVETEKRLDALDTELGAKIDEIKQKTNTKGSK